MSTSHTPSDTFYTHTRESLRAIWIPLVAPTSDYDRPERLRATVDQLTVVAEQIEHYFAHKFPNLYDSSRPCLEKYRALRDNIALARECATKLEQAASIAERDINTLREKVQDCQSALDECQACLQSAPIPTPQPPKLPSPQPSPPTNQPVADVELRLRAVDRNRFFADLRIQRPDSQTESALATDIPVQLDEEVLLKLRLQPDQYGQHLSAMVFAETQLRTAWAQVSSYLSLADTRLRLRLHLQGASELHHSTTWELLQDPLNGKPLCLNPRIWMSRYLDSPNLDPVILPATAERKALAMIANPDNGPDYGLPSIVHATEATRARSALNWASLEMIQRDTTGRFATRNALFSAIKVGYHIIYFACHGAIYDNVPYLWLEKQDGMGDRVKARELARRISDLDLKQRPLLVFLSVCGSAGVGDPAHVLAALGPLLATAGVGAVVGMQGSWPIDANPRLIKPFFEALSKDGTVDKALALARYELADTDPWWQPVLYMRLRNGRLWHAVDASEGSII